MSEKNIKLLESEIIINSKSDMFNSIRKKYFYLGKEAREKMNSLYDEKIVTLNDFIFNCKNVASRLFGDYLKLGVLELISYGIYNIDEEVLKCELANDTEIAYEKAIGLVMGKIGAIDYGQQQLDAERSQMIQSAGDTMHTVGFVSHGDIGEDVSTIVSSEIQDAAINAVFAGGTALLTGGIRSLERKGAENEKQRIFESATTKQSILIGIDQDVFALHKTVARLINERNEEIFYYPADDELQKMEPVIRNILRGNFASADVDFNLEAKQIETVLTTNPYELRIYSYLLKKQNGINDEIKEAIAYLCIDMKSIADSYFREKYTLADYPTYEGIDEFVNVVKEEMIPFEIDECDFFIEATARREEILRIRKTFNGFEYETIEKRDEAEEQFRNFFSESVEEMDIDDLIYKYFDTLPREITPKNRTDLQAIIMVPLNKKINEIKDSATLMSYYHLAEEKRIQYNMQSLSLIDLLNKKQKKLSRKENLSNAANIAMEKTAAATESVKKAGKNLIGKLPFGKKSDGGSEDGGTEVSSIGIIEESVPESVKEPVNKTCPQCGNVVLFDKKFCGKCGHKF